VPAPDDWLDRPLHVINVGRRGFAPLTWRDDRGLAGLAFSDPDLARRHADRAGGPRRRAASTAAGAPRPALAVITLAASDLRAREEWLRTVLDAGAARVAFDLPAEAAAPLDAFELTGALLAEVLSHKRGTACL
jgi:hypothetical protein